MKFGLRFALLAQTKCQNLAPSARLSRVTRLSSSLSSDRPSYDYASEDCTVVFDADGAYCMEEAALMSRVNVENCIRDSANPASTRRPRRCLRSAPSTRLTGRRDSSVAAPQEEECDIPPKYQELMDRIIQKKPKPKSPTVTVVDSEGSFEEYIGRPL